MLIDPSYHEIKGFQAGADSAVIKVFNWLLAAVACAFATLAATLAVGIATRSLKHTGITLAVGATATLVSAAGLIWERYYKHPS